MQRRLTIPVSSKMFEYAPQTDVTSRLQKKTFSVLVDMLALITGTMNFISVVSDFECRQNVVPSFAGARQSVARVFRNCDRVRSHVSELARAAAVA